jgi:phytoene dehydrogenase-like protein
MVSGEWDTIVIGAGMGGLTAAAKLVKAGQRVLVLEKNPHLGGTAYVYQRKGFTFPMGPLGFSSPRIIEDILHDLGERGDFTCDRVHYYLRAFGLELPLSLPFPAMTKELTRYFPHESQAIKQFFEDVEAVVSLTQSADINIESILAGRVAQNSASEYLSSSVQDLRLRRILGSLGTKEPYTNFALQAAMWNLMCKEGIWYPRGGLRSFCENLARLIAGGSRASICKDERRDQDGGVSTGVIKLRSEVKRISVAEGKVLGVILTDGTVIPTASVISNADYKATFTRLLEARVSARWGRAVSKAKQTKSIVQVCLGVDNSQIDLSAFREASRLIYRRSYGGAVPSEEIDWNKREVDLDRFAGQEMEVSLWSKEDRNLSPMGGEVIVIRSEAPYSHFARFRLGRGQRSPDYYDYKIRLAQALIDETKHLMPGLEKAILVMDVATPLTFEDQGGRIEGAIAGWSWDYEDFHDYRPRELVLTPIKGLYMAGYQAFSALFMGGVLTAMESGCRAATAVLHNVNPIEEIMVPGAG